MNRTQENHANNVASLVGARTTAQVCVTARVRVRARARTTVRARVRARATMTARARTTARVVPTIPRSGSQRRFTHVKRGAGGVYSRVDPCGQPRGRAGLASHCTHPWLGKMRPDLAPRSYSSLGRGLVWPRTVHILGMGKCGLTSHSPFGRGMRSGLAFALILDLGDAA
jgi:hypothetical protein